MYLSLQINIQIHKHMSNKNPFDLIFKKQIIILPILTGLVIAAFLSGKIIPMPSDFPYNNGTWGAIGVAIIILTSFIISFLFYVIACKKNKRTH